MKLTAKTIPSLALALMCLAGTALAQQPTNGKFGFAIHQPGSEGPPTWTWIPESGHIVKFLDSSAYPHDAHWDIVHANEPRPTIIELAFAVAENAVVFSVTAEYGERFRAIGTPVKSGPLPQALSMGSYMASETRSITLDNMVDLGLPAITIDIIVTPAGHTASISGRIVDSTGNPIPRLTLQLSPEHSAQEGVSQKPYTTKTAGDGSYSFTQLEPGAYILAVQLVEKHVTLTAGQQATDINLVLHPM